VKSIQPFLLLGTMASLALSSFCGAQDQPPAPKVYSVWPFDAVEAKRRQTETAAVLSLPVKRQIELPGGVPVEFVLIPAGAFTMGTPETEPARSQSEQQHQVRITTAFYLAACVVTQGQWQAVMGGNPSLFKTSPDSPRRPVEHVSYVRIENEFLRKLQNAAPAGWVIRLPTEAEWEWACRAGSATAFWFGDTITTDQANFDGTKLEGIGEPGVKRGETVAAGSFPANPWGLHEMHGNVFQWCRDSFGPYPRGPIDDPCSTNATKSDDHVLRGGCWIHGASKCRSGARYFSPASYYAGSIGFRLVLARPRKGPSGESAR
jgi:formylglycine-generating enzyme required for sulfatase activity